MQQVYVAAPAAATACEFLQKGKDGKDGKGGKDGKDGKVWQEGWAIR